MKLRALKVKFGETLLIVEQATVVVRRHALTIKLKRQKFA